MENIQEKMSDKISKFQNKFDKEKVKIESSKEKIEAKHEIEKARNRKAKLMLDMGMLLYEKIRKYEIEDEAFNIYCEEIKLIDKEIYVNELKLETIAQKEEDKVCECGYLINKDAKFCAECGKRIEEEFKEIEYIICDVCESEIDVDSKFCVCCGSKIL